MKFRVFCWALAIIAGFLWWGCSEDKTTGVEPDTTPPQVSTTFPADGDTGVGVDIHLQIGFSENMTVSTLNNQTIYMVGLPSDSVVASNRSATLIPPHDLEYDHEYTAVVTTGVRDAAGNRMQQNYQWSFTTASDTMRPVVFWTMPADGAVDVPNYFTDIRVLMSKAIDPASVTTSTFYLSDGEIGAVETHKDTLIFIPEDTLMTNHTYTATLTTGITDTLGNALAADYTWSFTTVSPSNMMPLAIGNMWEYYIEENDTTPWLSRQYYDTVLIVSDTVIDSERWFVAGDNSRYINRPDGLYETTASHTDFLRAAWPGSAGDRGAFISNYIPYLVMADLINPDTVVTVPAGEFRCQMYQGIIGDGVRIINYWIFYSPGVGLVRSYETCYVNGKTFSNIVQLSSYNVTWDE